MDSAALATWVSSVAGVGLLATGVYTLRRQGKRERQAHAEHRREDAKRVHVSVVDESSLLTAEIVNGGQGNICQVGVYVIDKDSERVFAQTFRLRRRMRPGEKRNFSLKSTSRTAARPTHYYCIAQFTDANGRWNKYMLGALEPAVDGRLVPQPQGCRAL